MISQAVVVYVAVGVLAVAMCFAILIFTKAPVVVMLGSSLATAVLYAVYGRIVDGYWDKFASVAFVVSAAYALVIAIVVLAIGRYLKSPFFLGAEAAGEKQR